jgi:hypothetical protein
VSLHVVCAEPYPTKMKKIADTRFGEVIEPESTAEMLNLIARGGGESDKAVRMWRGQSDEQWLLDSAAYRKVLLTKPERPMEWQVSYYEKSLLEKARHKGFDRLEGRSLSDFELLARLQHHGAATRLIDASRSGLIGLYFACADHFDRAGMLFGIHCAHLGGGEGKLLSGTYDEQMKSIAKSGHPQTWEPPVVSSRIAAQHSQFLYSSIKPGLSHGSLVINGLNCLLAIRIPADNKHIYLQVLAGNFDITAVSLFPDIDGFGSAYGSASEQWANERW